MFLFAQRTCTLMHCFSDDRFQITSMLLFAALLVLPLRISISHVRVSGEQTNALSATSIKSRSFYAEIAQVSSWQEDILQLAQGDFDKISGKFTFPHDELQNLVENIEHHARTGLPMEVTDQSKARSAAQFLNAVVTALPEAHQGTCAFTQQRPVCSHLIDNDAVNAWHATVLRTVETFANATTESTAGMLVVKHAAAFLNDKAYRLVRRLNDSMNEACEEKNNDNELSKELANILEGLDGSTKCSLNSSCVQLSDLMACSLVHLMLLRITQSGCKSIGTPSVEDYASEKALEHLLLSANNFILNCKSLRSTDAHSETTSSSAGGLTSHRRPIDSSTLPSRLSTTTSTDFRKSANMTPYYVCHEPRLSGAELARHVILCLAEQLRTNVQKVNDQKGRGSDFFECKSEHGFETAIPRQVIMTRKEMIRQNLRIMTYSFHTENSRVVFSVEMCNRKVYGSYAIDIDRKQGSMIVQAFDLFVRRYSWTYETFWTIRNTPLFGVFPRDLLRLARDWQRKSRLLMALYNATRDELAAFLGDFLPNATLYSYGASTVDSKQIEEPKEVKDPNSGAIVNLCKREEKSLNDGTQNVASLVRANSDKLPQVLLSRCNLDFRADACWRQILDFWIPLALIGHVGVFRAHYCGYLMYGMRSASYRNLIGRAVDAAYEIQEPFEKAEKLARQLPAPTLSLWLLRLQAQETATVSG